MKSIIHFCAAFMAAVLFFSIVAVPVALGASGDTAQMEDSAATQCSNTLETICEESTVTEETLDTVPRETDSEEASPALLNESEDEEKLPDDEEDLPEQDVQAETYSFFAESEEQAQEIAQSMGGDLLSFQYGIGTLRLPPVGLYRRSRTRSVTLYPEYEYTVSQVEADDASLEEDNSKAQWHSVFLKAEDAQKTAMGKGVLVAVIDSGIDSSHEDLANAIAGAECTIPADNYGTSGMFPAAYQGTQDNLGHGTHVAGIIGARKNGFGCTGIAPECSILSIKALERSGTQGKGRTSWVAAAISMAIEQGADIINLSMGGTKVSDEMLLISIEKALDAGIAVVCAAGNTAAPTVVYPAAYEGTIAVSAVEAQGESVTFASRYSNSGDWIDFAAPGSNIISTIPGGYSVKNGTSMACPMVSGALALMFSADPLLTSQQAIQILKDSARDFGAPGKDSLYGCGVLDLQAMTQLHQQLLLPDLPVSIIPTGSTILENSPISITTGTLHGRVIYTLDNSEPAEGGTVWPNTPVTFPEETEQLTITARTVSGSGALGTCVPFRYRFVPRVTTLTQDSEMISDVIPGYGVAYQDPVLNMSCRRYRIQLEAGQAFCITPPAEDAAVQYALFDAEGSGAKQLKFTETAEGLLWCNPSKEAKTVFLSLLLKEEPSAPQDTPYSFQFTRQDAPEEVIPAETKPKKPQANKPVHSDESDEASTQSQPTQAVQSPTRPAATVATEPAPQTAAETTFPEYEEDWLYAMEEPTETTQAARPTEQFPEEEEKRPGAALDFPVLLAVGIVLLFGLALSLLVYFTARKS